MRGRSRALRHPLRCTRVQRPLDDLRTRLVSHHTPEAIRERIASGPQASYLRDFVYGAIDGAVTTFAVVSGVAGADLSSGIVLVLGLANLVGDGFSMAAGNWLGTRADAELMARQRRAERMQIEVHPEGERAEVREIFRNKGFEGDDLERVTEVITSDTDRWIDVMLKEEHGMLGSARSPWRAAGATVVAFLGVGAIPLLAYLVDLFRPGTLVHPLAWSCSLTAFAFFVTGAVKGKITGRRWPIAGIETLLVGGAAASLAYVVGVALGDLARR